MPYGLSLEQSRLIARSRGLSEEQVRNRFIRYRSILEDEHFEQMLLNPVVHFDGADDWIRGTGMTAMSGAVTVAAIARRTGSSGVYQAILGGATAANGRSFMLAWDASVNPQKITMYDGTSNAYGVQAYDEQVRDWFLVVYTKSAGTVIPRFHLYNLSRKGPWFHENEGTSLTNTDFPSLSGGYLKIGNYDLTPGVPGSADEDLNGEVALVAMWDGIALSDAQVNELSETLETSDWQNNSGGAPTSITQVNSLTPTDLTGKITWAAANGGSIVMDDVAGWNFDGVASLVDNRNSGPVAITFHPALASAPPGNNMKGGQSAPTLTTHPAFTVTKSKGALAATSLTTHPALVVSKSTGRQSAATLTLHPTTAVASSKGGQSAVILTMHPQFTATGVAAVVDNRNAIAALTFHPALTAAIRKGGQSATTLTTHPALTSSGQKGGQASVPLTVHPAFSATARKGASGTANITVHPTYVVTGRKGAQSAVTLSASRVLSTTGSKGGLGAATLTFHPQFTATGGPPAQAIIQLTFHPTFLVSGKKGASAAVNVSARHTFAVTSSKGALSAITCTFHPSIAANVRKGGLSSSQLTFHPAFTTAGRKAALATAQLLFHPAFTVITPKRASATVSLVVHFQFAVTGLVGGVARPVRPINPRGYLDSTRTGTIQLGFSGDLVKEDPDTGQIQTDGRDGNIAGPQTGKVS